MARSSPILEAEVAPLEISGTQATRGWVRATEILLRAKARRDVRLLQEATGIIEHVNDYDFGADLTDPSNL